MQFSQIIGQKQLIAKLIEIIDSKSFAHAILLNGKDGYGNLALALAIAHRIACLEDDEKCQREYDKMIHPDLHIIFPNMTTAQVDKDAESKLFASTFRDFVNQKQAYGSLQQWYEFIDGGKKQGIINVRDADSIIKSLAMKSFASKYKVTIVWNADKMNVDCSNKILKVVEEPYPNTVFIFTTEHKEKILPTILSRVQQIKVPQIDELAMVDLIKKEYPNSLSEDKISRLLAYSQGDVVRLRGYNQEEDLQRMEMFVQINRLAMMYRKNAAQINLFADEFSKKTREEIKSFLTYFLEMIDSFYLYSMGVKKYVNPMADFEEKFQNNYPKFITSNNLELIYNVIQQAQDNVERNANAKINIFDMLIQLGKALEKR